jgi:hypothetical protein
MAVDSPLDNFNKLIDTTTYENCSVNNGKKYSASVQLYKGADKMNGGQKIKSRKFHVKRKNGRTKRVRVKI